MPVELTMVGVASVVLVALLLLAAAPRTLAFGLSWAAGPRDTAPGTMPTTLSPRGQRIDRAYRNMLETFPIFAALAVGVVAADASNAMTALGSQLYVVARILYVPAYVFHVQFLRSLIWVAAMIGMAMIGWPLVRGAIL